MDMTLYDGITPLPLNPPSEMAAAAPFGESYELIRELGRGGMAIVYLMRERATGLERAVKVIHTKFLDDEEALARFDREVRLVAQLKHPNIVATHSVRWIEAVGFGLVMDRVPGQTLKQMLRDGQPVSFEQATQILNDIASALSYAHARGIVHRDVKPENIFVDAATGRALLADFGIARTMQNETQVTLAGVAIGTPTYMAPEQIEGSIIDARSDLYSLGLVGWEMLTGRRPWDGETLYNVIYHQKHDQLAAIDALRPDAPERLVCAIERLLEKSPLARFQSATEFQAALSSEGVVRRARQAAGPAPDETIAISVQPALRVRRRIRRVAPVAAVGAALVGATLLFAWPVSNWVPLVSHDQPAAAHVAANAKRGSAGGVPHAPVSNYGVFDASGAGIAAAGGAAGSVTPPPATVGDSSVKATSTAGAATSAIIPPRGTAAIVAPDQTSPSGTVVSAPPPAPLPAAASEPAPPAANVASSQRFTIAAGGAHTCLISTAGGTYCWGANSAGQLGTGTTQSAISSPTAVGGATHFSSIAAGLSHTCALAAHGVVFCWGNNDHGQLGDGTHQSHDAPTRVSFTHALSSVVSGAGFSCGLAGEGQAYCWGAGIRGQMGDGTPNERTTPEKVSTTIAFAMLAAGWNHVCGLSQSGQAYCWGANDSGQLGDGSITDRSTPTPVRSDLRFTTLSAGSAHTCGVSTSGVVYCWGDNQYGQLGDGTRATHLTPFEVNTKARFVAISAGSVHTCAATSSGDAWCWGRNTYGQLGDGSTTSRSVPVPVSGGHEFTAVNSFGSHTCGTTTTGDLFCWGYNLDGQLGDGTREHRLRPTYIEKPTQ